MKYVVHYCKNKHCNNSWVDKDITNAKSLPPTWKYCKECSIEKGIDFDKQIFKLKDYQKKKIELMKQGKGIALKDSS